MRPSLRSAPAMWRHLLATVILTAAHGHLQGEDSFHASVQELRTLERTWAVGDHDFRGLAVKEPSVDDLARRRLFEFKERGISEWCSSASSWIRNTSSSVLGAAASLLGVDKVIELFKNATTWVEKGVQVTKKAWASMMRLEGKLLHIFDDFKPLKPIFANSSGLMTLITSPKDMGTLLHVVHELFNTSSDLTYLSDAVHDVSGMFREMSSLFNEALGRVDEKERRRLSTVNDPKARFLSEAFDYKELLKNLDFKKLQDLLMGFKSSMEKHVEELQQARDVLSPMLEKIDSIPVPAGRRLSGVNLEQILQDQQKYSRAIKAIIPTWQGIEKTGIAMCPVVAESNGTSGSLKCRVASFIEKAAVPSWVGSMISGLVSGCPAPVAEGEGAGCPSKSLSADISDLLGQNAGIIGWVFAASVAILGLLGIGGVAAVKKGQSDEEDDEDESDDEGETQPLR